MKLSSAKKLIGVAVAFLACEALPVVAEVKYAGPEVKSKGRHDWYRTSTTSEHHLEIIDGRLYTIGYDWDEQKGRRVLAPNIDLGKARFITKDIIERQEAASDQSRYYCRWSTLSKPLISSGLINRGDLEVKCTPKGFFVLSPQMQQKEVARGDNQLYCQEPSNGLGLRICKLTNYSGVTTYTIYQLGIPLTNGECGRHANMRRLSIADTCYWHRTVCGSKAATAIRCPK